MESYNLVSFFGIFILLGIAYLFSTNKKNVNLKIVLWGLALQFFFAAFIFIFPTGAKIFLWINNLVVTLMSAASTGAEFMFGRLALSPGTQNTAGEPSLGFIFAFQALPTIIFFSSLMSILYFFNIMPFIIKIFARLFSKLMKISGAESLCVSSNIFVGIESAFTIKPYLSKMTSSELCTILTAGMATVASNVLALYVFTLKGVFPTIAGHLISASFLSAPAALVMSKLFLPETKTPETLGQNVTIHHKKEATLFEAIITGADGGVKLIVGISALLIAMLGLVSLFDLILGSFGKIINPNFSWSLKEILGYLFYPLTIIIGIPLNDCAIISKIIGERIIMTEVVSYIDLSIAMGKNLLHHPRSAVIATYALCGFAHIPSMAIFVGGFSALSPNQTTNLSKIALRALVSATFACLLTACIAGAFFTNSSILLGK